MVKENNFQLHLSSVLVSLSRAISSKHFHFQYFWGRDWERNSITLSSMYMNSYFLIHHLQKTYWPLTMGNKKLLHIYACPSSLYSPRVLQFPCDYFQFSCYVLLCLWNYALILHFIKLSQGDGWWQPVLGCSHTSHPLSFGKGSSLPWVSTSMLLAGQSLHSIFVAMAAA